MVHPIEFYALRYLLLWQQSECALHTAMAGNPTTAVLRDSLHNYRVARNFKGIANNANAEQVLSALRTVGEDDSLSPHQKVAQLTFGFLADFGQSNLSAATKLLWLRYRSPFKIFDARAERSLKQRGHDVGKRNYAQFATAWEKEFSVHQGAIALAADRLCVIHPFVAGWHESEASVRSLVTQAWFQERIFDISLWEQGVKA